MKQKILSIKGKQKGEIKLPLQFEEQIRPDLIKRAVLAIYSHKRQNYGADPEAGKKHSSYVSKRRRDYKTSYGYGISRVARKIMSRRGTRFNWVGTKSPQTVGGRRAHPPKPEKKWAQKLNKKERKKAIRSALSASVNKEWVIKRGHIVKDYPLIVEDSLEKISKTKDALELMEKLGLEKELERVKERKIRAGRGKLRGRKYKSKKGPLFVVSEKCNFIDAIKNIPGVDAAIVRNLNAELLAPGTYCARLVIFSQKAINEIAGKQLFTEKTLKKKTKNKK
ncbi:50S ribosomal protein L4 [Candidatus Woesearchaeota archaeon]|nr:50S ribosomal protein L4 [Candidatus Woesearchaeota archaeon]